MSRGRSPISEAGIVTYYDETPTAREAEADWREDLWREAVEEYLQPLVDDALESRTEGLSQAALEDIDEDALREELREEFREEAEERAKEDFPCCNQFSCPCGNKNRVPD